MPQIFIKEAATVRKSLIFEEPFNPVLRQTSPILRSFGDQYPVLGGYVATSPKDLADIPLVTENDDPLLAHWRYGLGKTIAFTSDAKERWATAWVDWEQYAQFWAQAVRWSLRTPFNDNYQIQIDSRAGKVIIDAVDDAGEFKNHLDFSSATISTPSLGSEKINVRQVGPGRYEADFDITEPGTYMFGAEVGADIITGGTSVSYSPEFQHSKSNDALLYRLSDITHGRALDAKGESPVFLHNLESQSEPRSLWPALLSALLVLFLADVFVRRVIIGWSEVSAGWAIASSWMAERLGRHRLAPAGATEQLLRMKQSMRSEERAAPMVREDFLASLREVKVEKSPLAEALPRAGGFAPRALKPARATATKTTPPMSRPRPRAMALRTSPAPHGGSASAACTAACSVGDGRMSFMAA
ncbi:MAG: hypothetical protein IIC80_04435 [Chloroflexi bacterium]|nr:hypothetical protein [Chloroflexota bacterium]